MNANAVHVSVMAWAAAAPRAMPLRNAVFVVEQGVPAALERDAFDSMSRHVICETPDGAVVGTGRLLPDGRIGRMAVASDWRNHGIGGLMLSALVNEATARGLPEVVLHAQMGAIAFYRRHGFLEQGPVFMEAGIAHQTMRRALAPA